MPWRERLGLDFPRVNAEEMIDAPGQPFADVAQSMRDLALTNRLFGGTQTVLYHAARLLKDVPPGSEVRVLDIATGSGDIPRALIEWAKRRGLTLSIVAVDNQAAMLSLAHGDFARVQADALRLPFAPKSFDIALCALAFHHWGFTHSVQVLAAMEALTTRGFIVSDLRRDLPSLWGVQAAMALLKAHPFTRHDGPASVRRAFTPQEYRKMVALSGVNGIRVVPHWYFRIALVRDKQKARKIG